MSHVKVIDARDDRVVRDDNLVDVDLNLVVADYNVVDLANAPEP